MTDIPPILYRRRDLYFFVASRFVATLAMQVQSVAIGWQIYDMARTPWRWAWWGFASSCPCSCCTLPAGDITDRFNQRRVYSLAALLQAGSAARCSCSSRLSSPHAAWRRFMSCWCCSARRGALPGRPASRCCLSGAARNGCRAPSRSVRPLFTGAVIAGPGAGRLSLCAGSGGGLLRSASPALPWRALIVSRLGGRRFTPARHRCQPL